MPASDSSEPSPSLIWPGAFLAIAVLATIAWIASYFRPLVYDWKAGVAEDRCIVSRGGKIYFMHPSVAPTPAPWTVNLSKPGSFQFASGSGMTMEMDFPDPYFMHQGTLGFGHLRAIGMMKAATGTTFTVQLDSVAIPYWAIAALLGVVPAIIAYRRRRLRRQLREGKCLVCGYDLRASPERCPECGTVSNGPKNAAFYSVQK